jgi:hypothetical protein
MVRVRRVSRVVGVHGVGQQLKGTNILHSDWLPALRDGLSLAGLSNFPGGDLKCAFYGDLFRPRGVKSGRSPLLVASDLSAECDLPLLLALWAQVAKNQPEIDGPQDRVKARAPAFAQRALYALSRSRFFAGLSERALIGDLKQMSAYMNDEHVRAEVQERVVDSIAEDTRVLVGHSLGSVIAYEVLASGACGHVKRFISLGSPLGIPNLVFDRLDPAPRDGRGAWPGGLRVWINVSDIGDAVALEKRLAQRFRGDVVDVLVDNGAKAHDVRPYLTAVETGAAILGGLNDAA